MFSPNNIRGQPNTIERNSKIYKTNSATNVTRITNKKQKQMSNITIRKLQNAQNKFSKEEINQAARNLSELKIYNNQNTQKKRKSVHGNFPEEIREFGLTENNIQRGIATTRHRYRNEKAFAEQQAKNTEYNKYGKKIDIISKILNTLLKIYEEYKNSEFLTREQKIKLRNEVYNKLSNYYKIGESINSDKTYIYNNNVKSETIFVENPFHYAQYKVYKSIENIFPKKNNVNGKIKMDSKIFSELFTNIVSVYIIYKIENKLEKLPKIEDEELISIIFNTQ